MVWKPTICSSWAVWGQRVWRAKDRYLGMHCCTPDETAIQLSTFGASLYILILLHVWGKIYYIQFSELILYPRARNGIELYLWEGSVVDMNYRMAPNLFYFVARKFVYQNLNCSWSIIPPCLEEETSVQEYFYDAYTWTLILTKLQDNICPEFVNCD